MPASLFITRSAITLKGAPLFTIHANNREKLEEVREVVLAAHQFSEDPVERLPLFYE
jgi:thymidine phosphorylase